MTLDRYFNCSQRNGIFFCLMHMLLVRICAHAHLIYLTENSSMMSVNLTLCVLFSSSARVPLYYRKNFAVMYLGLFMFCRG